MFNFKNLKLDKEYSKGNTSSFVGIKRDKKGDFVFRLPKGFDDFPENDFDSVKKLFFTMYKTFSKFERDAKDDLEEKHPSGKDNLYEKTNGYTFKDENDEEVCIALQ